MFQCCEKEKVWEKGKEKKERKKEKRDTCDGVYPKAWKKRGEPKYKTKQNNGMEPQQKEKMIPEKGVKGGPNKTSTVTGKKGEKEKGK